MLRFLLKTQVHVKPIAYKKLEHRVPVKSFNDLVWELLSVAIAVVGLIFKGIVIAIGVHAANQAFDKGYESSERSYRVEK